MLHRATRTPTTISTSEHASPEKTAATGHISITIGESLFQAKSTGRIARLSGAHRPSTASITSATETTRRTVVTKSAICVNRITLPTRLINTHSERYQERLI